MVGAALAVLSDLLYAIAFRFRIEPAFDHVQQLAIGPSGAPILRWAAFTDMLGYYLLMAPTAFYLHRVYRAHPLIDLFTFGALFYIAAGSAGAVALGTFGPDLIVAYASADGPTRDAIARDFTTLAAVVYTGLWQTLLPIPLGLWFAGTGGLILARHPRLGSLGLAMGAAAFVASAGRIFGLDEIGVIGLAFLVPFTLWPVLIAWNVRPGEAASHEAA